VFIRGKRFFTLRHALSGLCCHFAFAEWKWLLLSAMSRKFSVGLLAVIAFAFSATAEWKSEKLNCAVTFPSGWQEPPIFQPMVKATAQSPDGTATISLMVLQGLDGSAPRVNSEFIAGAKRGFVSKGGQIVSERSFEIAEVPAYEMVGRVSIDGRRASIKMQTVIAGTNAYTLQAIDFRGDVTNNVEINHSLSSFRFLNAPDTSALPGRRSGAFQLGYQVGRYSPPFLILALVAFAIWKVSQRRKHRRIRRRES
jgi:hypothetical protein